MSFGAVGDLALLLLPKHWLCVSGANANVPNMQLAKIELKKMCGGKNKKYRSIGNEYRLTRCPILIWFVCLCSLIKIVYFFSRLCSSLSAVSCRFTLAGNVSGVNEVGDKGRHPFPFSHLT